ncbi:MAG: hypothetical protein HY747_02760 [Elusimicrobia bacterium]|nr:hypothetical protein [Elusimicrobiota bacterium]
MARLEEKDREIEQLRYQLERAVSGENQRLMNERIGALTARAAELETGLAAKEKELEDFKSYLSEQQSQTARQREEEAGESARQKLLLEEKIEQANIRLRQLEEESASLRRILVKEDERARQLEISCHGLEDERRALKGRLEILTGDVREHQGKLSRFLETAEAVPAKRSAEDEARRMPGAQDELYGAAFLADAAGPATEPYEWDEPLLGLEGRVGLDDQLFGDLPPETGEEK